MTILDEIIHYKRAVELPRRMAVCALAMVQAEAARAASPRDFVAALRAAGRVALIAEVKKASPSKGLLCPHFDPLELARTYATNGAAAISVLTDDKYFQGRLEYLSQIRQHLTSGSNSLLPTSYFPLRVPPPILRKDFIFDPYQVYESRAAGADALLLIAAVLNDREMADLLALTRFLGMTALIEVRSRAELERALPLRPRFIGVNNRNLHDFSVNLNTCLELRQYAPAEVCFVAESGIHTTADVVRLAQEGIDAILVGEALVKAENVADKVRELVNYEVGTTPTRPKSGVGLVNS